MPVWWWGFFAGGLVVSAFWLLIFQLRRDEFREAMHRKKSDAGKIALQKETIQSLLDQRASLIQGIEP